MRSSEISHLFINLSVGGGAGGSDYIGDFDTYADLIAFDTGENAVDDGSWASVNSDTGTFIGFLQGIAGSYQAGNYLKVDGTWTQDVQGITDLLLNHEQRITSNSNGLPQVPDARDATTDYILRVESTDDGGEAEFVQMPDASDGTLPVAPTDEGRYALDIDDSENASWTTVSTGHTIQNDGTDLTTRANLNFTGGLEATDDSVNDQSDVSISDGGVDTDQLADDAVTNDKMADDSVDSDQYVDASIDAVHLSSDSVTTEKIQDEAVTPEKLDNLSLIHI